MPCCAPTRSQLIYGAVFLTPKSAPKGITPLQAHETWKKSHLLDMNQDESGDSTPWHPCWSQMTWVKQRPKGSHGPLGAGLTSGGRPLARGTPEVPPSVRTEPCGDGRSVQRRPLVGFEVQGPKPQRLGLLQTCQTGFFNSHRSVKIFRWFLDNFFCPRAGMS